MGWFGSRITYDGAPSPRSRMKQTQLAQRVQCGWNSNGWTCKYARANVLINNTRVACRFCRFHQCKKNGGDAPCGVPTAGGFPFCQNRTFSFFFFLSLGKPTLISYDRHAVHGNLGWSKVYQLRQGDECEQVQVLRAIP